MDPQAQPVPPASALPASSFELRHLRYFLAVTEELNFTRAARKLNVVQQTLSEGIAQLESMLGLRLFDRATRPVALTDAAVQWLPCAREAFEAPVRAQDAADEPWIEVSESDPVWCDFWRLTALRDEPARVGASGQSLEDLLEAARTRQAIGVVPECVARAQPWPQLTFARVTDIPPSDVAVAWRAGETSPPVSDFIRIARELP